MNPSREVVTGIESGSSTLRITFPAWLTGDEREDDSDPSEGIEAEEAAEKYHELQEQAEKGNSSISEISSMLKKICICGD